MGILGQSFWKVHHCDEIECGSLEYKREQYFWVFSRVRGTDSPTWKVGLCCRVLATRVCCLPICVVCWILLRILLFGQIVFFFIFGLSDFNTFIVLCGDVKRLFFF